LGANHSNVPDHRAPVGIAGGTGNRSGIDKNLEMKPKGTPGGGSRRWRHRDQGLQKRSLMDETIEKGEKAQGNPRRWKGFDRAGVLNRNNTHGMEGKFKASACR